MVSVLQREKLELPGCTPEPLMSYLKALGVFRLLAEQKDPDVRACWRHDAFALYTILDREGLESFFLEEYRATPIVAPWNGGSGFYEKDSKQAMNAILASDEPKLERYREVIQQTQRLVSSLGASRSKNSKESVLAACRNWLPEDVLPWLDAAYVLSSHGTRYPPLLGTGGNDGRLEFSNNFMQNLVSALNIQDTPAGGRRREASAAQEPRELIAAALFGDASPSLTRDRTTGQFAPGSVGGPNATVGFEAGSLTNPWDYVLMMEGALSFAGAVARRLSAESRTRAIFPFTVDMSAAGYGTAVDSEYGEASRSELWVPLWEHPATYRELTHVFAEGRAQLGSRQAATGTDFARAVAGLGVERGISEFVRFGLLMRSGRAYLATPLGRFRVRPNPGVDVLFDIDGWLDVLRRLAHGQDAPEGLRRALRQIDQTIIEFCHVREQQGSQQSGGEAARRLQEVLVALGRAEAWLSRSRLKERVLPFPGLRPEGPGLRPDWLDQANDDSREFRIAVAIASIQGTRDGAIGPVRPNLEPVAARNQRLAWDDDNPSVVWQGVDLLQDMAVVLERRCLEARMRGTGRGGALPLDGRVSVPLQDIRYFLEGRLNERRIADLVLPLTAIRWGELGRDPFAEERRTQEDSLMLPLSYAVLKLLFLPWNFQRRPNAPEVELRPEPSILPLLRAGRAEEAYRVAWRRLYVSGFTPLAGTAAAPLALARRLAAALLIPIRYPDMYTLADMALMPSQEDP